MAKLRKAALVLVMAAAISGTKDIYIIILLLIIIRLIAKYGKYSSTLAHLSNSGNKNQAKILIAATHLGLCASE